MKLLLGVLIGGAILPAMAMAQPSLSVQHLCGPEGLRARAVFMFNLQSENENRMEVRGIGHEGRSARINQIETFTVQAAASNFDSDITTAAKSVEPRALTPGAARLLVDHKPKSLLDIQEACAALGVP